MCLCHFQKLWSGAIGSVLFETRLNSRYVGCLKRRSYLVKNKRSPLGLLHIIIDTLHSFGLGACFSQYLWGCDDMQVGWRSNNTLDRHVYVFSVAWVQTFAVFNVFPRVWWGVHNWWELPQVSFLSQQKFCCNETHVTKKMLFVMTKITFVATNTCCGLPRADRSMLVETKLSSQQTRVCPTYFWAYDNVQVGQSNIAIGTIKMALFLLPVARGWVCVYPGMHLFFNFPLHVQEVSGFCCCLFVCYIWGLGWAVVFPRTVINNIHPK